MADLMKSAKTQFVSPKKGESIQGTITKLTSSEILVDIGAKTEAQVLEKDKRILKTILSLLKVGDKVSVSVLNPESDYGNPVVSLRRFIDDKLWEKLATIQKEKTILDVKVIESTRGGFVVETNEGITGFLPNSHMQHTDPNPFGKTFKVSLLEVDRSVRKIIFSQKQTFGKDEFEKAVKDLKPDQKIDSIIASIAPFGVFVSIPINENKSLEGVIRKEKIPPGVSYNVGDKVQTIVSEIDTKNHKIFLVPYLAEKPIGYR